MPLPRCSHASRRSGRCLGLDSGPGLSRSWGWRLRLQASVRAAADRMDPFAAPELLRERLESPQSLQGMPPAKARLLRPSSRQQPR